MAMAAHHHRTLLSFFFFFISLIFLGDAHNGNIGNDPCQGTDYKTLCNRFVKGVPEPQLATEQLIGVIVRQTSAVMTRPELEECKGMYQKVLDDLNKSLENIKGKDKNALQNNLSAVIANYDSCNDALTEKGHRMPPNNVNRWLSHMAANCLGLVDQMVF